MHSSLSINYRYALANTLRSAKKIEIKRQRSVSYKPAFIKLRYISVDKKLDTIMYESLIINFTPSAMLLIHL
jgi:hypothetical protein